MLLFVEFPWFATGLGTEIGAGYRRYQRYQLEL